MRSYTRGRGYTSKEEVIYKKYKSQKVNLMGSTRNVKVKAKVGQILLSSWVGRSLRATDEGGLRQSYSLARTLMLRMEAQFVVSEHRAARAAVVLPNADVEKTRGAADVESRALGALELINTLSSVRKAIGRQLAVQ